MPTTKQDAIEQAELLHDLNSWEEWELEAENQASAWLDPDEEYDRKQEESI